MDKFLKFIDKGNKFISLILFLIIGIEMFSILSIFPIGPNCLVKLYDANVPIENNNNINLAITKTKTGPLGGYLFHFFQDETKHEYTVIAEPSAQTGLNPGCYTFPMEDWGKNEFRYQKKEHVDIALAKHGMSSDILQTPLGEDAKNLNIIRAYAGLIMDPALAAQKGQLIIKLKEHITDQPWERAYKMSIGEDVFENWKTSLDFHGRK